MDVNAFEKALSTGWIKEEALSGRTFQTAQHNISSKIKSFSVTSSPSLPLIGRSGFIVMNQDAGSPRGAEKRVESKVQRGGKGEGVLGY